MILGKQILAAKMLALGNENVHKKIVGQTIYDIHFILYMLHL